MDLLVINISKCELNNYPIKDMLVWQNKKIKKSKHYDWLKKQPYKYTENIFTFVHSNPISSIDKCLLFEDFEYSSLFEETEQSDDFFSSFKQIVVVGNNHRPWYFNNLTGGNKIYNSGEVYVCKDDSKTIISVGSVGKPQNNNPNSCYVILEDKKVTWKYVKYDVTKTIKKILKNRNLDNRLGERLWKGA